MRSSLVASIVGVVGTTLVYFAVPVGHHDGVAWTFPLAFAAGNLTLAILAFRQVRRTHTVGARVGELVALVFLAIVFFAHAYLVVEDTSPGEFAGLSTRIDALYLSVSVVTTVGLGDVHPVGELARALVTVQMLFNVFVLGVAVTAIRGAYQRGR